LTVSKQVVAGLGVVGIGSGAGHQKGCQYGCRFIHFLLLGVSAAPMRVSSIARCGWHGRLRHSLLYGIRKRLLLYSRTSAAL
jgi:hypothetical protein